MRLPDRTPLRLRRLVGLAPVASDPRSFRRLWHLLGDTVPSSEAPAAVRLRPLGGQTMHLRPGSTDARVLWDTFCGRYHVPEHVDRAAVREVWDLGANIGLTAAHYAVMFPAAHITAVELDAANAALARVNVAAWDDRCEVLEGAVWPDPGEVSYEPGLDDAWALHVAEAPAAATALRTTAVVTLDELAARMSSDVDFVKMDIEGAERQVLTRNTGWAARVRRIAVEVHAPYTVEDCRRDLETLGFTAALDTRHWAAVTGVRGR